MNELLQGALSGFLIGAVYGLIALGLNVIFGTIRVINFAQGSLLMVAMYISYWLWALFGIHPYLSTLVSVPLLFGARLLPAGLAGVAVGGARARAGADERAVADARRGAGARQSGAAV